MGISDVVSALSVGLAGEKWGRKASMIVCTSAIAVGGLAYAILPANFILIFMLLIVTRLGTGGSFTLAFLIAQEAYSTDIRGTVFGFANAFAGIGGLLAPFSSALPNFMLIVAFLGFFSLLLTLSLKETKDLKMEDSITQILSDKQSNV